MNMTNEHENPVNRALLDIIKEASGKGTSGPLDLDALMEAKGGQAAARWRAAGILRRASEAHHAAEQVYWNTVDLTELKLATVATLRMAETTLLKTDLTSEHRQHGWSEGIIAVLASKCAEFRSQVETDTFANPRAGYELGRTKLEEVSPMWRDTDELSVALGHAERMLDILSRRLELDPTMASE
jgi:hypothetical protein